MEKITLSIDGMHCTACALRIEKALSKTEGVISAKVNFATEEAYVQYDPAAVSNEKLFSTVHNAGYKAVLKEILNLQ